VLAVIVVPFIAEPAFIIPGAARVAIYISNQMISRWLDSRFEQSMSTGHLFL